MSCTAFVLSSSRAFLGAPVTRQSVTPLSNRTSSNVSRRRVRLVMSEEPPLKADSTVTTESKPVEGFSMDTTMFSDFVESAEAKIEEFKEQVQEIDGEQLVADITEAGKGLIDNLLAGDWLNRGELYGALQVVLVLFILNPPGFLDGFVALLTGPVLLAAGSALSAKSVYDLGRKQLSIWPAPVPGADLKTEGLYEVVRHPMYAGLLLASIGFAMSTGSPARLAVVAAMAVLLLKKIDMEEDFLMDSFPEYATYVDKVPFKLIPRVY